MSEIDLERGEPDPDETPAARRRRERRTSSGSGSGGSSSGRSRSNSDDSSLVTRLDTAFGKIADQIAARYGEDDELAIAIREERHPMSVGLVSLTATLTFLRWPLIIIMALVEPFLAFFRVGRIALYRWLSWRERRILAAQQAAEEAAQWQEAPADHTAPQGVS